MVAITTAMVVALSCGGNGDEAGPAPADETSQPSTEQVGVKHLGFLEMLAVIPDTSGARRELMLVDLTTVRELYDISLPGEQADNDAVLDYLLELGELRLGGPFISGMDQFAFQTNPTFRKHLSFDARNVDRFAWAMTAPGQLEVVWGSFEPEETDRALWGCTECPEPLRQEHRGVPFYSWGEDMMVDVAARLTPPAFDQIGRGGRIAVQRGRVFRTVRTNDMEDLIDASEGKSRSLADVDEFERMAQAIETMGAYGAFLSDLPFGLSDTTVDLGFTPELNHVPLRPYKTFATGAGKDAEGAYMVLVLVHDDADLAGENKDRLQAIIDEASSSLTAEPWSEFVDSTEIETEGSCSEQSCAGNELPEYGSTSCSTGIVCWCMNRLHLRTSLPPDESIATMSFCGTPQRSYWSDKGV